MDVDGVWMFVDVVVGGECERIGEDDDGGMISGCGDDDATRTARRRGRG